MDMGKPVQAMEVGLDKAAVEGFDQRLATDIFADPLLKEITDRCSIRYA